MSRHRRRDDDELLEAPPSRHGYEPRYEPPAQRRYEAPGYEPPGYEAPGYEAPRYEAPGYEAPRYEAPRYEAPGYEAPGYEAPGYEAPPVPPAYTPPAYERPRYEAPPVPPAYTPPAYPPAREAPQTGYVARRPTPPLPSAARARKPPKTPKPAKQSPPRQPAQTDRAGRLRLRINPITCDGHGLCAELLPELLTRDEWGYPAPVVAEIPAELESHAQRAAQQCPTLAIVLERRLPPRRGGP